MHAITLHGNPFDIAHRRTEMVSKSVDSGNLGNSLPKADSTRLTQRGKRLIEMMVDAVDKENTSAATVMAHLLNKFGDNPVRMKAVTDYLLEYGEKKRQERRAKKGGD